MSVKNEKNKRKIKSKGFSLVEIIAAIAILAILMLLATSAYNVYKRKARQQAYDAMAKSAAEATEDYLMENAKEKYITFERLKEMEYVDTLQDPRYRNEQCSGIVISKVVQGSNQKQLDILFQKVKLCCKNYKYQYDYTGDEVKMTEIENCNYVDGDEIDGVYKLVYKPQGGSVCDPKTIIKHQDEEWGPLCITTRTKYAFKGWNTKKNGSGSTITEHTKVGNKDINAYAIWNPIYTLKFDSNGGTACTPSSIDKEKGNKWGILCTTSKTGYAFKGWNTKKNGEGSIVTKDTYAEKNMTVYAEWNPYYTLTYNSNGGAACNPTTVTKEKGQKWGTLCTPTRSGYTFLGWKNGEETITKDTISEGNITITASWKSNIYTLTYNSNGGSACSTKTGTYGSAWGTLCTPTKTGYKFNGWKNGEETITKDTICNDNLTITASWEANKYTLTYNSNGGSACSAKTGTYGSAWGALCAPTKTGYKFKGWKSGTTIVDKNTICKNNLTVTANWEANKYTLTYNNNGGSGCSTKTVTYDSTYGTLCTPSRSGYSFEGWYTAASGGTKYSSTTKVSTANNHTLYAHWKQKQKTKYTATFNLYDYYGQIVSGYSQTKSCETYDSSCTVTPSEKIVYTRNGTLIVTKSKSYTLTYNRTIEYDSDFQDAYYYTDSGNGLNARDCPHVNCSLIDGLNVGHSFIPYEFSYEPNSGCSNNIWVYGTSYNEGWTGWVCSYYLY